MNLNNRDYSSKYSKIIFEKNFKEEESVFKGIFSLIGLWTKNGCFSDILQLLCKNIKSNEEKNKRKATSRFS